jgi:tRNA1Val (adenine37-N6)-methyltransferase
MVTGPNEILLEGERIDRLGYQGLQIIQDPRKFKFTIDAFLLAGFIEPKPHHRIVDLGTGGGVLPLLIAGQREVERIFGIEIQPELVEMAQRSVQLNNLNQKIFITQGDIRELPLAFQPNTFDYVIANPPFFQLDKGVISENNALAQAKFEISCTLEDLIKTASRLVKANGKVALIYPTERLLDLFLNLNRFHLTPKKVRFIHPKPSAKSNLILVEARPGAKNGTEVPAPLFIYDQNGEYSPEMNQIFHGKTN